MATKEKIDWFAIITFLIAVIMGVAAFWFGEKLIHNNEDAVSLITTVFSIFAGFVVAITTILGTPVTDSEKQSWRTLELRRGNVFRRLTRQKWLFVAYMLTLLVIFVESLIDQFYPEAAAILERIFLGMAVTAFVLSLGLPGALIKIQLSRYDEIIEEKKKAQGNHD